jgi:hypothetical protein
MAKATARGSAASELEAILLRVNRIDQAGAQHDWVSNCLARLPYIHGSFRGQRPKRRHTQFGFACTGCKFFGIMTDTELLDEVKRWRAISTGGATMWTYFHRVTCPRTSVSCMNWMPKSGAKALPQVFPTRSCVPVTAEAVHTAEQVVGFSRFAAPTLAEVELPALDSRVRRVSGT